MRDGREGGRRIEGSSGRGTASDFFFFFLPPIPAGGKCLCKTSETIAEVKVTQIKHFLSFGMGGQLGSPRERQGAGQMSLPAKVTTGSFT